MSQSTAAPAPAARAAACPNVWARLRAQVEERLRQFQDSGVTPLALYTLEKELQGAFDEAARALLERTLNGLEPVAKDSVAARVRYHKQRYRVNKRTKAAVATSFGTITLWSWLYLCVEDGEPGLHPLLVRLGIGAGGATPLLAERVARRAVDDSQQEVRQWLATAHGLHWSNDRLRSVLRAFRRTVTAFRAEAQQERLLGWLAVAEGSRGRHRPVLGVGRDGVMVPIRGHGYQEAGTATVTVYDRRGKRLGTVYLGQMPEAHQATLSDDLTALVTAVLGRWTGPWPRLVYVTDKGQAPNDYYWRVLRRLPHPRQPSQRLGWEWVLDFFHVAGYLGKLREALFGADGYGWFRRMRHWLRDRVQGVAHVLRSAVQHYNRRPLSKAAQEAFWKAYRYLRRHRRWMDYARYRRLGLPIGSGVTEAACKTVFTQRFKRAGMRWRRESGQVILDLRVMHLSGIWAEVVRRDLQARALPEPVSSQQQAPPNRRKVG
jgi:hypothetical protein